MARVCETNCRGVSEGAFDGVSNPGAILVFPQVEPLGQLRP